MWLAVFFIALYVVASRLALPRVGSIIADRRARIAADLAEAARMKSDADAAIASYEKDLADARARAQGMAAETAIGSMPKRSSIARPSRPISMVG